MTRIDVAPLEQLRRTRTSVKWTRYPADVLPLFVAEMDFDVAPRITETLVERVRAGDTGYLDAAGPLAPAFARFAAERWGWTVDESRVHLTTDVSVGIVETLRHALPATGGRVVINPPVYPPFFELVDEARAEIVEVPLQLGDDGWSLDVEGLERAFAAGADAFLLCNPHNPLGLAHWQSELEDVARLAAKYDVLVVSDEIHAPLTHPSTVFTPFLPVAASAGARAVCVTSASKGWNIAGVKCAIAVAGDGSTAALLAGLPEEVACRASILGLHANVAAYESTDWLDAAIEQVVANDRLLADLLAEQLPAVVHHRPGAGYLAWLDLRPLGLGERPAEWLIEHARVALNVGENFGREGTGFGRFNLACSPDTVREAVRRIASAVAARDAAQATDVEEG